MARVRPVNLEPHWARALPSCINGVPLWTADIPKWKFKRKAPCSPLQHPSDPAPSGLTPSPHCCSHSWDNWVGHMELPILWPAGPFVSGMQRPPVLNTGCMFLQPAWDPGCGSVDRLSLHGLPVQAQHLCGSSLVLETCRALGLLCPSCFFSKRSQSTCPNTYHPLVALKPQSTGLWSPCPLPCPPAPQPPAQVTEIY